MSEGLGPFRLTLVPLKGPGWGDSLGRLKAALKRLLRTHGFRCERIELLNDKGSTNEQSET